ncbi:sulfurtransferase-like selenium metabolism protein YedF [Desulfogranum mediterraneum]|uniref:sulfurtransferase-like selenium metabolism protein YedF n=1 Tax=Desulfogranum mediterraneum TaxID=160661 RepID=UPI000428A2CD|nr:sulfurtransferase-like selenium metabolism protein YedF [Desulfogranum mediterraneum]
MSSVHLDCLDLPCPKPVLKTKQAFDQGATEISVLLDNESSMHNVSRFGRNQGCSVEVSNQDDGTFLLTITAPAEGPTAAPLAEEEYQCQLPPKQGLIYVIAADTMGRGDDELGWALLQTFVQTIKEVEPLPEKILFYNGGVKLVTEGSGALEALLALQQLQVEILVCGTCLDFYGLKSAIKVGQISNMYDIMSAMAESSQVISPH